MPDFVKTINAQHVSSYQKLYSAKHKRKIYKLELAVKDYLAKTADMQKSICYYRNKLRERGYFLRTSKYDTMP